MSQRSGSPCRNKAVEDEDERDYGDDVCEE